MSYFNTKLDDFEKSLNNKKVAIIGLGVSNLPMLDYLHSLNANVSIFDKKNKEKFDVEIIKKIKECNFIYILEKTILKIYMDLILFLDLQVVDRINQK